MALLNVLESQRNEIFAMLEGQNQGPSIFNAAQIGGSEGHNDNAQEWKVLIYDAKGQRILSTLLKVGALRLRGITLHLNLHNENKAGVPEVPAIYFCEPSDENLARIERDLCTLTSANSDQPSPLYLGFRFNFISPISTPQLQSLAGAATQAGTAQLVESVLDRYLGFVSLSPTEFELGIRDTYITLNGRSDDFAIESQVESIVAGLLSLCLTLKVLPVVRCSSDKMQPSRLVAETLTKELKRAYDSNIFRGSAPKGHAALTNRPCLMILDRDLDLSIPLEHAWSYRGLVKDMMTMDANRVTFEVSSGSNVTKMSHDLDQSDSYWEKWMEVPFPELLSSVNSAVEAYDEQMKQFASKNSMETNALSTALTSLPVMTEKKRLLDLHTNLNTVLLEKVNARSIDQFHALEEGIFTGTMVIQNAILKLTEFFENNVGDATDRWRACQAVCGSRMMKSDKQKFVRELKPHLLKYNENAVTILEWIINKSERANSLFMKPDANPFNQSGFGGVMAEAEKAVKSQTEDLWQGKLGQIGKGLLDHGKGFVMQGMKAMMGIQRATQVTETVKLLMSDSCSSRVLTFDPLQTTNEGELIPLTSLPGNFSQGIVFMAGEGSFMESQNIRSNLMKQPNQHGSATNETQTITSLSVGGNIVYGCTAFESPSEFSSILDRSAQ